MPIVQNLNQNIQCDWCGWTHWYPLVDDKCKGCKRPLNIDLDLIECGLIDDPREGQAASRSRQSRRLEVRFNQKAVSKRVIPWTKIAEEL